MGVKTEGRRLPDVQAGEWPEAEVQPGDYWQVADARSEEPSNLTGSVWMVVAPRPTERGGFAAGRLAKHTVREEEDGTISVRPGDGSSNSVLILGAHGFTWHGYIEHGVWEEC